LPTVLILLGLSGLLIAPCLGYASTSLNSGRAMVRSISGVYAADAGVEDALWCLENGIPIRTGLPQTLNGMGVTIQTEVKGDYNLYAGQLMTGSVHDDWLAVTGNIVEEAGVYKYTITVMWQAESGTRIHVVEVGARLPVGHNYQPGSAAVFGDNLSTAEPNDTLDGAGAHMLKWALPPPYPYVEKDNPIRTQKFYVTGEGDQSGSYAWVVANRSDIGTVGEIRGTAYTITATATKDGEIVAVVAEVLLPPEGEIFIVSWQINPQQE